VIASELDIIVRLLAQLLIEAGKPEMVEVLRHTIEDNNRALGYAEPPKAGNKE
jgi:hypothetical protein